MKAPHTQQRTPIRLSLKRQIFSLALAVFAGLLGCWSTTSRAWAVPAVRTSGTNETISTGSLLLQAPAGVAIRPDGTLFIANSAAGQVLRVTSDGSASALPLSGLASPKGLALDNNANLYVVDSVNNKVFKVAPDGTQSRVDLGSITLNNPYGIAVDAANNIYISEPDSGRILRVPVGGAASVYNVTISTPLNNPSGLAVDPAGNLYIADKGNDRIVKVASGAGVEIASGGSLSGPVGVALDNKGMLYVCNETTGTISTIDTSNVVSSYDLYDYTLATPGAIAVDPFGSIYIADTGNNQIRRAQKRTVGFGHVTLGSTTPTTRRLQFSVDAGTQINSVQLLTLGAASQDFRHNSGTTCAVTTYGSATTCTIAIDFLPVASGLRQGAVVVTSSGGVLTVPLHGFADAPQVTLSPSFATVVSTGTTAIANTYQIAVDGNDNLYAGSYMGATVYKIPAGGGSATPISTGSYAIGLVTGIALDSAGNLYVADHAGSVVLRISPSGATTAMTITANSQNIALPTGLAIDVSGDVYVADYDRGRIVKFTPPASSPATATITGTVVSFPGITFKSDAIYGVDVDSLGNVYTANGANSIYKLSPAGVVTTITPSGLGAAVSSAGSPVVDRFGNISLTDINNSGLITLASDFSGTPLSTAGLPNLMGMAFTHTFDANGNIYYPDWSYGRIVFVCRKAGVLVFASTDQGTTSADSPKSAVVANVGNQNLTFSAAPSYPSDFVQSGADTITANTTLSPGQARSIGFNFTPQVSGGLSEKATITNNDANQVNAAQQIMLVGDSIYPGDTTAITVSVTPTIIEIGAPVSITVSVSDTTTGKTSTIPTGMVTITDTPAGGSAVVLGGAPRSLSGGTVTLSNIELKSAGTHIIEASYAGVSHSFLACGILAGVTVSKTPVTLSGPVATPVNTNVGKSVAVAIALTQPYSANSAPSGAVNYAITDSSSRTVKSGAADVTASGSNAAAQIIIPGDLVAGSYTLTVSYPGDSTYAATAPSGILTVPVTINRTSPIVNWAPPASITYGNPLTGILNAAATSGNSSVPGTFTYSAGATVLTPATMLDAGSHSITATFTPTDAATYSSSFRTVTLTVTKATSAISLAVNSNPVLITTPVTFTATVASAAATPTGSVSFYDGATALGTAALNNGKAAYTTTSLSVATHSITASYVGSNNFVAATSAVIAEVVQDYAISPGSGGSSGGNASTLTQTVLPGGTATYTLALSPANGGTFPAPVTLTVSGVPAGATATLNPTFLPAGSSLTNVTLTVALPKAIVGRQRTTPSPFTAAPVLVGLLLLPCNGKFRKAVKKRRGTLCSLVLLFFGTACLAGLSGCGAASSGFFGQKQTSYTLTITATSGSVSRSTNVTLTVQ